MSPSQSWATVAIIKDNGNWIASYRDNSGHIAVFKQPGVYPFGYKAHCKNSSDSPPFPSIYADCYSYEAIPHSCV